MSSPTRKEQLLTMLAAEPEDVFLNYGLAMEYLSTDNFNEAEMQFKKVLSINPNYLACYYQLGQVNEKLDNIDTALTYYKQGIELAKSQGNNKALGELNEAIWMLED
jgi:Tfp pilus assembly protein PilF